MLNTQTYGEVKVHVKYTHDHRHTCMETGEIKVHVKYTHDDRHMER